MSEQYSILPESSEFNQILLANVKPQNWQNPTPRGSYNLVVIGGGSGGLVAAAGAAGMGARVALVERHLLGGDCLNTGCLPSKTIIRSARVMAEIQRAGRLGVQVPEGVTVDFAGVMERMRRIRAHVSHHDSAQRFASLGIDFYQGDGSFAEPGVISVAGQRLPFKKAVIATGSRALHLPIPGLAEAGYLTNESVFNLTERPHRLAVIGAGPIGCELAQTFQRLGSQVTIFEIAPQILIREDKDAAAVIQKALETDGIQTLLGVKILGVSTKQGLKTIRFEQDGQEQELGFNEILLGAGRVPNIESLNLEAAGIESHKRGITVDDHLRTTNPHVFAVGDVALPFQFTHTADMSARIALQNALFPGPKKKWSDQIIPWVTYTQPEIAHVGLYETDAQAKGIPVQTLMQPMDMVDRALADGDEAGFVKVHVKQGTDQILGATIVADHAGEMLNEITLAMNAGLGLKTLSTVIHPYPTQAEAIRKVADQYNRTRLTPTVAKAFQAWFRWSRR